MDPILDTGSLPLAGVPKAVTGWRRKINTAAFIFALFAGGFGTGFIYAQRSADVVIAQQRTDHLNEIKRLQKVHQFVLESLAYSAGSATESAAKATSSAATATESAAAATKNAATATGKAAEAVGAVGEQKLKR